MSLLSLRELRHSFVDSSNRDSVGSVGLLFIDMRLIKIINMNEIFSYWQKTCY